MDLFAKAVVAAIVIVIILAGLFYSLNHVFTQQLTEQQATTLVLNDIHNSYPSAVVNVTNVSASQYSGSWHIVVGIVFNSTTPCPSYYVYTYDYPQFHFVPTVQNTYTTHCVVYGLMQNSSYILGSYPVAIARATSLNTTPVNNFIRVHGYNSTIVHANFYNSTTALGATYRRVWVVNYSAASTNSSVHVVLSQVGGALLATFNTTH